MEVLLAVSNRQQGLATSTSGLHYLWTFGPSAIFTLIGALWARIEYQSKVTSPWYRMTKGPAKADQSLLLDYLSMMQPVSVVKAIRNGDYAVAAIISTSILIKIIIAFSTGLITLSVTDVSHSSVPVTKLDRFINSTENFHSAGDLPYSMMYGLVELNFTLPDGITVPFAYPRITSDLPPATKFQTTLDGFSADLDCEPAAISLGAVTDQTAWPNSITMNLSSVGGSSDCQIATTAQGLYNIRVDQHRPNMTFSRMVNGGCGGSTACICTPTYNISALDITRNSTQTLSVALSNNSNPTMLDGIHAWDLVTALLASYSSASANIVGNIDFQPDDIYIDPDDNSITAIRLRNITGDADPGLSAFPFDEEFIYDMWRNYWQQFAAIIAYESLMDTTSTPITASAITMEDRLLLVRTAKARDLPSNPSSLSGIASLLIHSEPLLASLSGLALSDPKALSGVLGCSEYQISEYRSGSRYFTVTAIDHIPENDDLEAADTKQDPKYPTALYPLARVASFLALAGLIAGLEVAFQLSKSTRDSASLVGLYFGFLDFQARRMIPYINLSFGSVYDSSAGLDLLDRSMPSIIVEEIRTANYAALFNTMALGIASLLTIISASLFHTAWIPTVTPTQLQTVGSFITTNMGLFVGDSGGLSPDTEGAVAASFLVLESNLTYPAFTYENLAFPEFQIPPESVKRYVDDDDSSNSTLMINITVPALRPRFACRLYDPTKIEANITSNDTITLYIPDEAYETCSYFLDSIVTHLTIDYSGNSTGFFFGLGTGNTWGTPDDGTNIEFHRCSSYMWAWGHASTSPQPIVTSVSALGCNQTLEGVDVATTFFGTDLYIDPSYPPIPNESTVWESNAQTSTEDYDTFLNIPSVGSLDRFFSLLTTSHYGVPADALENISQAQAVADAIVTQQGIMDIQSISWRNRYPASNTNATLVNAPIGLQAGNDSIAHNGTLINTTGTDRVLQDAAATRILEAILGAVLAFSALGWLSMQNTRLLPCCPTSIASAAALLVDGNVVQFLARGVDKTFDGDLSRAFPRGTMFRMGWGQVGCEAATMVDRFMIVAIPARDAKQEDALVSSSGGMLAP
ncbi:uncharacterized protein LY89DRAFT_789416 [Mollisia scopiformis]|uniref:Uncharacterized protein n=1 Tax=Mollisia scopiformis TaxID=149040 RepID=A0A132B5N5_MOLSC|nr:uncharacterized protein LY89DRAFT_789416 [Mollisia scopiformis]KUJ07725.1 hypothetical protein LY89DRAFT_789416 [Mollisia scopiformis]